MKTKSKKGTHVGVVLSFVIFVTFLIFIYSILGTKIQSQTSKQNILDELRMKILIEDFLSSSVEILTINYIAGSPGGVKNCIQFNVVSTNLDDIINDDTKNHLKIKNENGDFLNYQFLGEGAKNLRISPVDSEQDTILKVYYSEDITSTETSLSNCKHIDDDKIVRGQIKTESIIIESNIISLIERYNTDCGETLKTELGVPEGSDFIFSFEFADETIIKPTCREIPNTLNIYAARIPVIYLDEDANILLGYVTIKVW